MDDFVIRTIGFPSRPSKNGGPGSFQFRFESYLKSKEWLVIYPDTKIIPSVVIINGSTKHFLWLLKLKLKGTVIIYRLGGINWLYKKAENSWITKKVKQDIKIALITLMQSLLGDSVIYQSEFSREWLIKFKQSARFKHNFVIHNGVDLNMFKPVVRVNNLNSLSIICVEGNLDYTPYAIELLNLLQAKLVDTGLFKIINLYGDFERSQNRQRLHPSISYHGIVSKERIPDVYRDGIFLSLDINPGCPNSVLEALASGIPVVGYDTGSLKELILEDAGILVPYRGDPWNLDFPDVNSLIGAIERIKENYYYFSRNARQVAEKKYSLSQMSEDYINVINHTIMIKGMKVRSKSRL